MTETTIPFGIHKGSAISECPIDYLDWLIGAEWFQDESWNDLRTEVENYLENCPEWQRL